MHYDTVMHGMFVLMVIAWVALIVHWSAAWSRSGRLRTWSEFIGGDQLAAPVLYISMFLLYNSAITAAFVDPDYRQNDFMILIKLLLAGLGGIVLVRLAHAFLRSFVPSLVKDLHANPTLVIDSREAPALAIAGGLATAICAGWAWYVVTQAW